MPGIKIPLGYRMVVFFDMARLCWIRGLITEEQAKTFPYRCYKEWFEVVRQTHRVNTLHKLYDPPLTIHLEMHYVLYENWMSTMAPYDWNRKSSKELFRKYADRKWITQEDM